MDSFVELSDLFFSNKMTWKRRRYRSRTEPKKLRASAELIPMLSDAERLLDILAKAAFSNEAILENHRRAVDAIKKSNETILGEVRKIWASYHAERSFFSKLFDTPPPAELTAKIASLRAHEQPVPSSTYGIQLVTIRNTLGVEMWRRYKGSLFGGNPSTTVSAETVEFIQTQIRSLRSELERSARQESKNAKLAAADNQTRSLAKQVKAKLRQQLIDHPECPYCGNNIGCTPEADHIYPVVSGGLSTPENMVYICKSCNSRKSSLTLAIFIRQMGFDREQIEVRLERLGKRF